MSRFNTLLAAAFSLLLGQVAVAQVVKISQMPPAAALAGSEAIPGVQAGANVRLTPAQLKTYINGATDSGFTITKPQAPSRFSSFSSVANGTGYNAFQSITLNGTVLGSTNANFLATATPDNVSFSGWGVRGGTGTSPLVVGNFGSWIENNSAIAWATEIDSNNEGATQAEGSDNGGVGLAINTGSTYSPDTAISIRRATGAGSGPGFLRGLNIEGARNVGVRVMAMDTTTYPSLTPAAPGTLTAFATGKSSDAQYQFTINQSGALKWGPGGSTATDTTLQRTAVNTLTASGTIAAANIILSGSTVAGLPTCAAGLAGAVAYVTDATAPTYNATLTGGGAVKTLGMCNGTAWTAH